MTRYLIWWNSVRDAWTLYDCKLFKIVCVVDDKCIERFAQQLPLPTTFIPWIPEREIT
jgi:hypothetical protein